MDQSLQTAIDLINKNIILSEEEKSALVAKLKEADKKITITEFKLDRTEKVKRTTAILLEETIEELEQKRKAVEAQNHELEIETALERVRAVALGMKEPADMLEICRTISQQLELLHVKEIRNVQTAIFYESKGTYMNYEYYAKHDKTFITETSFTNHEIHRAFANQMLKGKGEFYSTHISKAELPDWIAYQKTTNVFIDSFLETAFSLNYHWFSLGTVALGISTYEPLKEEETTLFKRFLKVFELSYTRYLDIEQAEAQAREAQIQLALERVRARTMAMQKSDELTEAALLLFEQLQSLGTALWSCGFNIWEKGKTECTSFIARGGKMLAPVKSFLNENSLLQLFNESKQKGEEFWFIELSGEDSKSVFRYVAKQRQIQSGDNIFLSEVTMPSSQIVHLVNFSHGNLMFITLEPHPEFHDIFKRFGKVFEQTYTRFLDLQKAEAQAKEAQIEAALEKVRSRSLAMHKSDELGEVVKVVLSKLNDLDIKLPNGLSTAIFTFIKGSKETSFWITGPDYAEAVTTVVPYYDHPIVNDFLNERGSGVSYFSKVYGFEEKNRWWEWALVHTDNKNLPNDVKKSLMESKSYAHSSACAKHSGIYMDTASGEVLTEKESEVLIRFANVFEQAYIRFLDLQKAEVQAREAEIELGLERVRSRAMAMQTSEELNALIGTVFTELTKLDLVLTRCVILIYEGNEKGVRWWMANSETPSTPMNFFVKYADIPFFNEYLKGWYNRELKWQYCLEGENKIKTDGFLFNETELSLLPDFVVEGMKAPDRVYLNASFNNFGNLTLATLEPLSEEHFNILLRFAKVFDLTYTRFNDLKQAEAQVRESQIQLALERARTQSMIMQHSKELDDTLRVFHEQVLLLDIHSAFSFLWLPDEGKDRHIFWAAWAENNSTVFKSKAINYWLNRNEPATAQCLIDWKSNEPVVSYHVPSDGVENYFAAWSELIAGVEQLTPGYFSDGLYYVEAFMKFGCFGVMVANALSEDEKKILIRFAVEFERAYTRFLDLQKAEAQTKESQIQLALERVRARTMAMQKSDELSEAVFVLFQQFKELGENPDQATIGIINENEKVIEYWVTMYGNPIKKVFKFSLDEPNVTNKIYTAWKENKKSLVIDLGGDALMEFMKYRAGKGGAAVNPDEKRRIINVAFFSRGLLNVQSNEERSEESIKLLERFAAVFEQTYTRFLDLQKAEVQVMESQIETALEKVRSRTLAMQKSDELAETSAVLFKQLIGLGIAPNRLYIGIINDGSGNIEFWITDEDGSKVSTMFSGNAYKNASIKKMYDGWKQQQKFITIDMHGKELADYFHYLGEELHVPFKDGLSQKRRLQYITYFSKGFIGMASPDEQPEETIDLLERFASVFNLTFTRFNDLKIAEAHAIQAEQDLIEIKSARQKAEDALVELQVTQKHLIQSEKMASLGELTAGIAHEIQNPLNFVNNFSEVSNELLDEMNEELAKGDIEEAKAIAADVRQNLEKINHHGKRAGDIVKGMLQHSQKSTGVKEPTDINELCDEYLRLSYHGMRAKDKSFNADFKTDFDQSIDKTNIIPQDIGRVLLNLYNNAFYATNEKKKTTNENYYPTVTVQTKRINACLDNEVGRDKIEIKVSDNGNGIPQKIVDKIFQPFFTTKPTGEGTGLGLSLSYDIVKAHGGEIKVETAEGEGTTFIIQLSS